jgi:hypothetical protein
MKKINKLLLCLSLFTSLSFAGCAVVPKPQPKPVPTINPVESKCRSTCKLMDACSLRAGRGYSNHDKLICKRECLATHPILRDAVFKCSKKVLRENLVKKQPCNTKDMSDCVQKILEQLQKK